MLPVKPFFRYVFHAVESTGMGSVAYYEFCCYQILCQFKDLRPINLGSTDGNKNLPEHRLATDAADKSHIGD